MATLIQLWNYWEIHVLVLVSFMLQVFLFFFGGLRRRMRITNIALNMLLWLAYLIADLVAVYTLGQLSLRVTGPAGVLGQPHQLIFLWTPFLVIHLGGQDTITAFSFEDNEIWPRHLLNLLVQAGLALYILWKSAARDQFVGSAMFAFIAGIIKYGERAWALKCASRKSVRSSTTGVYQFPELEDEASGYLTMVKFALSSSVGVKNLFAGRKLTQMEGAVQAIFSGGFYSKVSRNGADVFKILEIELTMIYDILYTKARVICTWAGSILRFVTLIFLLVAFVLFVTENKHWQHSKVDVAITYTLFIGALCLDVCGIFIMLIISPWTWAFFRSWKCHGLEHAAWHIFKSLRPETRPWWSSSIGQYNFINSCFSDSVIGKMMNLVGAKEFWRNLRHTTSIDVTTEIIKLLFEDKYLYEALSTNRSQRVGKAAYLSLIDSDMYLILRKPLEEAIISLHIYTDLFLHQCTYRAGTSCEQTNGSQHLIRTCRTLSEYMFYLLVVHPDMLPVTSSVRDVLDKASYTVTNINGTYVGFLQRMATDHNLSLNFDKEIFTVKSDPVAMAGVLFRRTKESVERHPLESLQFLVHAWLGLLVYAAGRSRGELHAKQLTTGGELLTFLWLHLAHLSYGDMGAKEIELVQQNSVFRGGRRRFILYEHIELPTIGLDGENFPDIGLDDDNFPEIGLARSA